jgi:hypothetical protein
MRFRAVKEIVRFEDLVHPLVADPKSFPAGDDGDAFVSPEGECVSELLDALDDALRYLHRRWTGSFPLDLGNAMMVEEIGNTGYFIFKIPYWLYKKESNMQVKRLEGKKRFVQPDIKGIEDVVPFQVLEPAMEAIGADIL